MANVFLDTNVLQDILANRPGVEGSVAILRLIEKNKIRGSISALSIPTVWYLNRKLIDQRPKIKILTKILTIIPLTEAMIAKVVSRPLFGDLEDELQYLAAKSARADFLITRNIRDFPIEDITVLTPEDFLEHLVQD